MSEAVAGLTQAEGLLLEGERERGQQKEKEGEAGQLVLSFSDWFETRPLPPFSSRARRKADNSFIQTPTVAPCSAGRAI